jgi:MerR family transcriptional regulator, copper efflux regulator
MTSTYRIAEVAERSGFTPATLRYYEEIGLLAPTGRTPAGYRVYDDGSIERLRFIARAKQLGCTLDEVADLAAAWDGGRCSHVQARLRAAAEAKVADAHARIAELTTLAADLQRALVSLARSAPDGPCDETCGCYGDVPEAAVEATATTVATATTAASAMPIAVPLIATPVPASSEAPEPIACTLDAAAMGGRLDEWAALLASKADLLAGVTGRAAIDGGVRLEFGPGTDVGELARLAAAEQGCCRFFSFALVIDGRGLALEVSAPDEAADVVTALFGATDR